MQKIGYYLIALAVVIALSILWVVTDNNVIGILLIVPMIFLVRNLFFKKWVLIITALLSVGGILSAIYWIMNPDSMGINVGVGIVMLVILLPLLLLSIYQLIKVRKSN